MDPNAYAVPGRLGFVASSLLVYGAALLIPGILLTLAAIRAWTFQKRARAARAWRTVSASAKSFAAGRVVLSGKVDAEGPEEPIVVRIRQAAHPPLAVRPNSWREIGREVTAKPFKLFLDSGEVAVVEPDERVALAVELDRFERDSNIRTGSAAVRAGQHIHLMGVLRRKQTPLAPPAGYRELGVLPVVRGTRLQRLVVSDRPLDEGLVRQSRFHTLVGAALVVLLVVFHGLGFHTFHRLNIAGRVVLAENVELAPTQRGSALSVRGTYTDGSDRAFVLSDRTNEDVGDMVRWQQVSRLPFLIDPEDPTICQIGTTPGVDLWLALLSTYAAAVAAIVYVFARRKFTPWYERARVVHPGDPPSEGVTS